MQGRQGGDGTAEHAHGVGVIPEGIHHRKKILVHEGMIHNLFAEGGQFLLGGQLAPEDKIGDLKEGTLLSKDFDGVAPVLEDALVAVDEADGGCAGDGVHVAGVIAPQDLALV